VVEVWLGVLVVADGRVAQVGAALKQNHP